MTAETAPVTILTFARGVAAALGGGWRAVPSHDLAAFVRHADGRGLFLYALQLPWSARGRVQVTGEYPQQQAWRRRDQSVTVSMGRDPKSVARDLQRRLLPVYEAELAIARAAEVERLADEADVERVAEEIMAAVPGSERGGVGVSDGEAQVRLSGHGYRHNVRIRRSSDGTAVDIDMRGVPAAEAVRMLGALGAAGGSLADAGDLVAMVPARRRPVLRWLRAAITTA
jgi:hypothetical protein